MDILIIFAAQYLLPLVILFSFLIWLRLGKIPKKGILKVGLIAFPLSYLIAAIFKIFIYESRPFVVENVKPLIPHAPDNSFPSDHTLLILTVASVFYIYNRKLGIFIFLLGLVVGLARVMAKVHYPIDIITSGVIAILSTYGANFLLLKNSRINSLLNQFSSRVVR
ncbi:phosphatase PAP2 family protein [Candidatus Curtissbacteria bacterium]|nr:phosphatase PAP2 family protein [Candidatus Curtissbacteria bacterium]